MIHESGYPPVFGLNSQKKVYSAMKVSRLGSLTELTQQNVNRRYRDNRGGTRRTPRG